MADEDLLGLPASFGYSMKKSSSLSSLPKPPLPPPRIQQHQPVNKTTLGSGVLRYSRSLPQLSSITSLSSIPEEGEGGDDRIVEDKPKNLNLRWGGVEEYIANEDTDSRTSSVKTDPESEGEEEEEIEEEEEEDGWGWYEEDNNNSSNKEVKEVNSNTSNNNNKERRSSRAESLLSTESQKEKKQSKPLVRVLSQSTPLDPLTEHSSSTIHQNNNSTTPQGSLLLLGSDQWPERRTRRRRGDKPSKQDHVNQSINNRDNSSFSKTVETRNNFLESLVVEARSKGFPVWASALVVFLRGSATGYAMRAIPNYLLRLALSFYREKVESNHRESVSTGLFLGLSMATYHVLALNNVNIDEDDEEEEETSISSQLFSQKKDGWIVFTSALLTPYLALLPFKSRLSITLFVAARAMEAFINGLLSRLSKSVREQIPVSKWLFALGSAQVVFCWLFHRSALPSELATFLDKASSFHPDTRLVELFLESPNTTNSEEVFKAVQELVYPPNGEPLIKRILLGSGAIELLASDVFSVASLFGPVFDFRSNGISFTSSFARGFRSACVLIADATLSGFALISLTRLLRRLSPSNGWWAGFVAGLVAIQGENEEPRRVELALFALLYAARALYNMAASRQILPANVKFGEFGLYFISLFVVLKATSVSPKRRNITESSGSNQNKNGAKLLVIGTFFRNLVRRCVVPG